MEDIKTESDVGEYNEHCKLNIKVEDEENKHFLLSNFVNVNKTKSDTKIKIEVDENTSATQPACKRFKVEKLGTETSFLKTEIKKEIMEDDIRLYETQILEKSSSNVTNIKLEIDDIEQELAVQNQRNIGIDTNHFERRHEEKESENMFSMIISLLQRQEMRAVPKNKKVDIDDIEREWALMGSQLHPTYYPVKRKEGENVFSIIISLLEKQKQENFHNYESKLQEDEVCPTEEENTMVEIEDIEQEWAKLENQKNFQYHELSRYSPSSLSDTKLSSSQHTHRNPTSLLPFPCPVWNPFAL